MNKTGFGFLRLPRIPDGKKTDIDYSVLNPMVDRFLESGGDYFDTAYTYLGGVSEEALRKALVERHPRSTYRIATKLPGYLVKHPEECHRYFTEQLERCGVDYFDVYLLHWLNETNYAICEEMKEFAFLRQLKAEGKVKKIGFSYHDSPELLDKILSEHPQCDYVQLQINYLDWDSVSIQARRCYEVAVRHGKNVIVMEPVKGGNLAAIPEKAEKVLDAMDSTASTASWAIRFATGLEHVEIVLSGMNTMQQMEDNMQSFQPLTEAEQNALCEAAEIIRSDTAIACTGCSYCSSHCPMRIPIPRLFALYNDYARNPSEGWKMQNVYDTLSKASGKVSDCVACRQCERNCPQKLPVTQWLSQIANVFE